MTPQIFYYAASVLALAIAAANGFILFRLWRKMREIDRLQNECEENLCQAIILKQRFEKLNPDYADPTD